MRITSSSAKTNSLFAQFRELYSYRKLIWVLTNRNLRIRYKGSALGIIWSLILPVVQVAVLTVVFNFILHTGVRDFSAYMLCAFLPWIFFNASVLDASSSVLSQLDLLKKVYIPREIFPIATILANLIHFGAALAIFLVYRYVLTTVMFIHHTPQGWITGWPGPPPASILMFPFVLLDLVAFTLGLSFYLAAVTTFYEDVKYIVQAVLSIMFYALPIVYFTENIFYSPEGTNPFRSEVYHIYLLEPMAWIVSAFKEMFFGRQVLLMRGNHPIYTAPLDFRYFLITTATSFIVLIIGYGHFNKVKWEFNERP